MQKKKIFILTFVFLFSLVYADNDFTDTNNHWAEKYIRDLSSMQLIKGYTDGTFKPDREILNVEVYSIINHLIKEDLRFDLNTKTDYKSKWYFDDLQKAKSAGYANINENFEVRPITRLEMVNVISKVYNLYDDNKDMDDIDYPDFKDVDNLSKSDMREVASLVNKKILKGYLNGTFRPDGNLTRAEFCKILSVSNKKMNINGKYAKMIIVKNGVKLEDSKKELKLLIDHMKNINIDNLSEQDKDILNAAVEKAKGVLKDSKNAEEINQSINDLNNAIKNNENTENNALEKNTAENNKTSEPQIKFVVKDSSGEIINDFDITIDNKAFNNNSKVKPGKHFAKIEAQNMEDFETYVVVENENKTIEINMEPKAKGKYSLTLSEGLSSDKSNYDKNERVKVNINIPEGKRVKKLLLNGKEKNLISDDEFNFIITENTDIKVIFG